VLLAMTAVTLLVLVAIVAWWRRRQAPPMPSDMSEAWLRDQGERSGKLWD
jgi:hypothetical protein